MHPLLFMHSIFTTCGLPCYYVYNRETQPCLTLSSSTRIRPSTYFDACRAVKKIEKRVMVESCSVTQVSRTGGNALLIPASASKMYFDLITFLLSLVYSFSLFPDLLWLQENRKNQYERVNSFSLNMKKRKGTIPTILTVGCHYYCCWGNSST